MEGQLHRAGEVISDRYQIIMPLGQGSSATTYAANDLWQNQRVAIKVLSLRNISEWKILDQAVLSSTGTGRRGIPRQSSALRLAGQ
jgi:serine/threonine protein kinase